MNSPYQVARKRRMLNASHISNSNSNSENHLDNVDSSNADSSNVDSSNVDSSNAESVNAESVNAESNNEDKPGDKNDKSKSHVKWSYENEQILVEWCDVAQCYKWLNSKAHGKYSYRHAWFTIPAITLSTISGTASFAQTSIPLRYQRYAPMIIGTINILIGILTTIQQYLKISELNESHRVSAISWDKFARNIRIELAKDPSERMDAKSFIKISRQEFDRLMETSPAIPEDIIRQFKETFEGQDPMIACSDQLFCCIKTFCGPCSKYCIPTGPVDAKGEKISLTDYEIREKEKRDRLQFFKNLKKPDICDIIVSAEEYRFKNAPQTYLHLVDSSANHVEEPQTSGAEILLRETLKILTEHQNRDREEDSKRVEAKRMEAEKEDKNLQRIQMKYKYIQNFTKMFVKKREREPNIDEIKEYFQTNREYEVSDQVIDDFYMDQL